MEKSKNNVMNLIHYSSEVIPKLEKREYSQSELIWQAKPNGLWVSVEYDENIPDNYNWNEWCKAQNFQIEELKYAYEIILKQDANILHLKTPEEIREFSRKYPLKTRDWDAEHGTYQLRWDVVKKEYQGIIISPYQWDCRLAVDTCWYYGWDCSSGCIWDLECVKEFIQPKI